MVARILTSKQSFRGLRPFNAARDSYGVAHLLEEAFRPDHNFPFVNVPFLREVGITLWTLSYAPGFPDSTDGFVWVEDGKIVGNVTLNLDRHHGGRYYVSNVAVKQEYRRQGIARAMMQATIEYVRAHHGQEVFLNVRPTNYGAVKLYQDLGFHALETRGEWVIDFIPPRLMPADRTGLRPMRLNDDRVVIDLLQAATPEKVRRFRIESNPFQVLWDDQLAEAIADFFTGQSSHRWVLEREGRVAGLMYLCMRRFGSAHKLAIQVHPDFRGQVEETLVLIALHDLARFPAHAIHAEAVSAHVELIDVLERYGFHFANGLTLMELTI